MKTNKALKVLTTSALLASVAAPFGAGVVSANITNLVNKVLNVKSNYDGEQSASHTLTVKEDDIAFDQTSGETFRVVLPSGVKWKTAPANTPTAKFDLRSDQVLEVTVKGTNTIADDEQVSIPLNFKVDGATGELKLKVESMDSTITSGEYVFAIVGSGSTTAAVDNVKNIGKSGKAGTIRVEETAIGAVADGRNHKVKLKLPSNFRWVTTGTDKTEISTSGGFTSASIVTGESNDNVLVLDVATATGQGRGVLYVTPYIKADKDASYGDVSVNIRGPDFSDSDVVVAKYGDWGATIKVEKVEEVLAGKYDENTRTAKITIEESVPGSFVKGRDIDVELPSWVKVTDIKEFTTSGFTTGAPTSGSVDIDGTDNKISIPLGETGGSSTAKIEFKLELSVQADKTGDIEAVISGGGVAEQKAVIAKAVAPVSVALDGEASKVKIGAQAQDAPNIIITELKKGAIEKTTENGSTTNGTIEVKLPDGVKFASVPKVEVVEGDGTIDVDNVRRINNDNVLTIPVKGESVSKPMKIKLSNVKLTVDRTVPEGDIELKVGGNAIVENYKSGKGWLKGNKQNGSSDALDAGEFNTEHAAKVVVAKTVTPAPTDTTATNIVFKLNSKTYTVDGKEFEMDAAPLVGWDRAYLPVRFAANALNVSDDQIVWDDKTSTFTIFKGDRVISGKVGDKFLTVNGAKVPMDVPVWRNKEKTNNRVMVPIRYLANALNAEIEWNKETSEITIQAKK
uniref:Surface-layer glycoprotein SatB n=1 Tax=Aneurinibacillus thermoaerophilus TaxID=143495 RepID=Q6TL21_ANETH|nr:surface-layer glycoprotein SatB precursor [Aneurinibacillus thermoaerophilus]